MILSAKTWCKLPRQSSRWLKRPNLACVVHPALKVLLRQRLPSQDPLTRSPIRQTKARLKSAAAVAANRVKLAMRAVHRQNPLIDGLKA
jgi:hypothetical protein